MTRTEHLLWILAEECAEVAQRASKAARFGLSEVQEGQKLTNKQRITQEIEDLIGVIFLMESENIIPFYQEIGVADKQRKIEKYLKYSATVGTLDKE